MPRIPNAELERLKEEVSVARLVESAGIELRKSGKDLLGQCPFHADDKKLHKSHPCSHPIPDQICWRNRQCLLRILLPV